MKKIISFVIGLILLSMIQSASAIGVGGMNGYTKAVHYDDANMTKIEFTGVLITRSNLADYNNEEDFEVLLRDFGDTSVKHVCEGTTLSAEERLFLTGGSLMQIDGECIIYSSIVPKSGRYDMEWDFPSDSSLEFSIEGDSRSDEAFIEITPIQIDTDQGKFEYINHLIWINHDGLNVILRLDTNENINPESLTFEINSSISDDECEGVLTKISSGYQVFCTFPEYEQGQNNIDHSYFIELENPWDNSKVIDYSFEARIDLVKNLADEENLELKKEIAANELKKVLESRDEDKTQEGISKDQCIQNVWRNSLAISHSGINLQTSARLKNALEKFYDTVETKFDTFEMQDKVYNEILEKIVSMKQSDSLSANAKNILLVLTTNIGYRLEEQKNLFSCEEYGVDFESLFDVNLD